MDCEGPNKDIHNFTGSWTFTGPERLASAGQIKLNNDNCLLRGAQLRNIAELLTQQTGVPCYVAENPMACVALGAGKALENYEIMRRSLPMVSSA